MASEPVLVLGDGGFGMALAIVLHDAGREVRIWGNDPAYASQLQATRENPKFLPGIKLPRGIVVGSDVRELAAGASQALAVVPTQFLRAALARVESGLRGIKLWISCSKGFERETLERPSQILGAALPHARGVVLSGPSHAEEVSRGLPTTVVAAAPLAADAAEAQSLLSTNRFRVYRSPDPLGVEVGGAAKNVIALAAGIADGLGFGDNARAGLITRGLREITRLGMALGAHEKTFAGLSGMGDLIVTCTSRHSRNYRVGERIAQGETLDQVLGSTEKVAEGVETTRAMRSLAARLGVPLPITEEVYSVLFAGKPPREAVEALMARESKDERD